MAARIKGVIEAQRDFYQRVIFRLLYEIAPPRTGADARQQNDPPRSAAEGGGERINVLYDPAPDLAAATSLAYSVLAFIDIQAPAVPAKNASRSTSTLTISPPGTREGLRCLVGAVKPFLVTGRQVDRSMHRGRSAPNPPA